jgi:succinate dehydrogenase / fumarate reductase membrane anchor subunit
MAMVLLVLWGVWSALHLASAGYDGAVAWLRSPLDAALLVLLLGVGFFHARIGIKVIVEDYVHQPLLKTAALVLNLFVCVAAFAVSATAALKVALSVSGGV